MNPEVWSAFGTLFIACFVSGVLVPVPEDVPLILAGLAVARGEMPLAVAVTAGASGTLARDGLLFALGRLAGRRFARRAKTRAGVRPVVREWAAGDPPPTKGLQVRRFRILAPRFQVRVTRAIRPRLAGALLRFEGRSPRQQDVIVFLTRFAIGARGPLYFVAGLLKVPARRFVALDLLGLVITTPLCLWVGYRWGEASALWLTDVLAHQRPVLVAVVAVIALSWALRHRVTQRRR